MDYKSNYYKLHEIKDAIEASIEAIGKAYNQHKENYDVVSTAETKFINEEYTNMLAQVVEGLERKIEINKKQLQAVNDLLELEHNELVNEAVTLLLYIAGMCDLVEKTDDVKEA